MYPLASPSTHVQEASLALPQALGLQSEFGLAEGMD